MPTSPLTLSNEGLALIKEFEGLRLQSYADTGGVITIGYGTTRYPDGVKVCMGERCLPTDADAWLEGFCARLGQQVRHLVTVPLTQGQFDALVSFAYNLGLGALTKSTLLKELNVGNYEAAAAQFLRWNKARVGGTLQEVRGLTRRRVAEKALFDRPPRV